MGYLRDQKRYALHTLRAYRNDLNGFFGYTSEEFGITESNKVSREMVRSYIVHMVDEAYARRTIQRKISCLKSYYNFLQKKGLADSNPVAGIQLPRAENELPAFMTREVMQELLELLPVAEDYPTARIRMLLLMLYGTGMRVAELTALKVVDLRTGGQVVRVLGKRNKERDIPLGSVLGEEVRGYLLYRKKFDTQEDAFFLTDKGKPLYPKWVYNNVRSWLGRVSTQEKRSPHILRHSFATHMLDDGADLNAIKEILGHANLAATQVYTHNTIEKLRKIYEQAHPRA